MASKRRREILNQKDFFFCVPVSCHLPKARPIRHTNTKQSARGLCFGGRGGSSRSKKDAGKKKSPGRLLERSWGEIRRQLYWSRLVRDAVNRLQSVTPPSPWDSRDRLHPPPQDTGSFISLLTILRHVKKVDNSVQKPANELSQQQISIDETMDVILWGSAFMWLTSEPTCSVMDASSWNRKLFFPFQQGGTCGKARNHRPSNTF